MSATRYDSDQGRAVQAARDPDGAWELYSRQPCSALRAVVRDYQGYRESAAQPIVRRELPHGGVVLIVDFGAGWNIGAPRAGHTTSSFHSFVAGIDDFASVVGAAGPAHCLQVNLTPLGARQFFGIGMHALARRVVSLDAVLGCDAGRLADRLFQAPDWSSRFDIVEALIARRVADAGPVLPGIAWAWRALERQHGLVRIGALARQLDCSRKHLGTMFREEIGLPPKTVASLMRFDRARRLMDAARKPDLARIAAETGYADQAHFNRDFKTFGGITPGAYLRARLPDGGGLLA